MHPQMSVLADKESAQAFWLQRPLGGKAKKLWTLKGVPHVNLLTRDEDEDAFSIMGRHASWKGLVSNLTPRFIPGNRKVLLLTDVAVSKGTMFDCTFTPPSAADGEVGHMNGDAARSWVPLKVSHFEFGEEFFHFGNYSVFEENMRSVSDIVVNKNIDCVAFLGGFRDIEKVLHEPAQGNAAPSSDMLSQFVENHLQWMSWRLKVPIIFGGLLKLGHPVTRRAIDDVHTHLFRHVERLRREARVTFLDCSSPSPSISAHRIWNGKGGFRRMFRANCLFGLSQLVAVTLDDLLAPSSRVAASYSLRDRAGDLMRSRAGDM